jgi:hypothetical protein
MNPRFAAFLLGCFAATSLHADLTFIPNTTKYRDTGIPNAKGRSGSAAIEARALLGKDGATELVVTTGSLESDTAAAGTIDKVQLKGASGATKNFTNLSGAVVTETLDGLFRRQALQLQANVRGIDGSRTDVVAATAVVKLRPDLAVERLSSAPYAAAGVPMQINAIVRERNGDSGARANCLLLANGAEVDRANGIWVDANGTVTCQFEHIFDAAGTQQLRVTVDGVAPGDYDLANNSATKTVRVFESVNELPDYLLSVRDEVEHRAFRSSTPTSEDEYVLDSNVTFVQFDSIIRNVTKTQWSALRVSYAETHDGNTTVDIADAPFVNGRPSPLQCSAAKVGSVGIEKCWIAPRRGEPFDPVIRISVFHGGGEVTYHSHGWYDALNFQTGEYDRYTYNEGGTDNYGPRFTVGNSVAVRMQATDGTQLFESNPFVNVAPYEYHENTPYSCFSGWDGEYCSGSSDDVSGREAWTGTY